jgi:hypothetical protein
VDNNDRDLILGLATRLRQAPPAPQDPQAAELISHQIASQPNSLYLLVQAVLLQEDALRQAQARIAELEATRQTTAQGHNPAFATGPAFSPGYAHNQNTGQGGFISRTFSRQGASPYPAQQGGGGSFLKTAGAAAAGVAGGALLVAGVSQLFSDDQPAAAQGGEEAEGFGFTDFF